MARPIWKGAISFGMVSIPVSLFTAASSKDISFNMLHDECKARVKQVRRCPVHEKDLTADEIVKGFEYSKGQYVVLTDEDFEKVALPSKHTIEVTAFVEADEIDPVYYERSYYIQPEDLGVKPYALLMRAMEDKKLTALAKIAMRNRESLCALRAANGSLLLETLYYADEVQVEKPHKVDDVELSDRELGMAHSLIDLLAEHFEPAKYQDEYRGALMQVIESKLTGLEMVTAPEPETGKVIDLMAALKASVEAAKKRAADEPIAAAGGR
ncbi:MAG: YkoV protein [Chloroflexi bacterium]|nr:YkoV protein [Chloroflexota bacterium]